MKLNICAALFACRPIWPPIKPRDATKEFQQKAIQFHGTFHGLKIRNCIIPMEDIHKK